MIIQEAVLRYNFHARPCAYFVNQTSKFEANITIVRGNRSGNGKSVISVMMLELAEGDKVKIVIDGNDEEEAMKKVVYLIENSLEKDW
ncbi:HPr family phosphocarrier protein [Vallitalea guaymasensis]|uniref:HPr family phosphocarrier protein n=1 Tax=Vallitalea guaymasensis TaxID=1185412 RepID=A0A8J8MA31_9FIRM|nr:HPr family phosphocarrier protein [Vallitalea guaymasensis]QUH28993.1 HPr family phosphocarrier protein [Vallitalea guaymasensis]